LLSAERAGAIPVRLCRHYGSLARCDLFGYFGGSGDAFQFPFFSCQVIFPPLDGTVRNVFRLVSLCFRFRALVSPHSSIAAGLWPLWPAALRAFSFSLSLIIASGWGNDIFRKTPFLSPFNFPFPSPAALACFSQRFCESVLFFEVTTHLYVRGMSIVLQFSSCSDLFLSFFPLVSEFLFSF